MKKFVKSIETEYRRSGIIGAMLWAVVLPIYMIATCLTCIIMGEDIG